MSNLAPFTPLLNKTPTRRQSPVARFSDLFDVFFNDSDFFGNFPSSSEMTLRPSLDIAEGEKEYTVAVELPGVEEKDISLEVENRTVKISGEKKRESEEKGKNWHRVERSYGSFQRVLALPEDVNEDKIDASFKDGVLTVTLPRSGEASVNKKRIKIKKA